MTGVKAVGRPTRSRSKCSQEYKNTVSAHCVDKPKYQRPLRLTLRPAARALRPEPATHEPRLEPRRAGERGDRDSREQPASRDEIMSRFHSMPI